MWDDETCIAWDKMTVAEEYLTANTGQDGKQPLRLTTNDKWNPLILYQAKEGQNLLLKENLL